MEYRYYSFHLVFVTTNSNDLGIRKSLQTLNWLANNNSCRPSRRSSSSSKKELNDVQLVAAVQEILNWTTLLLMFIGIDIYVMTKGLGYQNI